MRVLEPSTLEGSTIVPFHPGQVTKIVHWANLQTLEQDHLVLEHIHCDFLSRSVNLHLSIFN